MSQNAFVGPRLMPFYQFHQHSRVNLYSTLLKFDRFFAVLACTFCLTRCMNIISDWLTAVGPTDLRRTIQSLGTSQHGYTHYHISTHMNVLIMINVLNVYYSVATFVVYFDLLLCPSANNQTTRECSEIDNILIEVCNAAICCVSEKEWAFSMPNSLSLAHNKMFAPEPHRQIQPSGTHRPSNSL